MSKLRPEKNIFPQRRPTTVMTEVAKEEKSDKDTERWKEVVRRGRKVATHPQKDVPQQQHDRSEAERQRQISSSRIRTASTEAKQKEQQKKQHQQQ